jgi:hypothetical protein
MDEKSRIFEHFVRKLSPEAICGSDSGNRFLDAIFDWTGRRENPTGGNEEEQNQVGGRL